MVITHRFRATLSSFFAGARPDGIHTTRHTAADLVSAAKFIAAAERVAILASRKSGAPWHVVAATVTSFVASPVTASVTSPVASAEPNDH